MTYLPNIPLPTDLLSDSQRDIKNNFTKANTSFGLNHYAFDNGTVNNGKHQFVEIVDAALPVGLVAGEGTNYCKFIQTTTAHNESCLFYTPDATTQEYQITRTIAPEFTKFAVNNAYGTPPATFTQIGGWTFLPGGILVQYGFFGKAGATGSSGQIQFPVPYTTSVFTIQLTLFRNSGNQSLTLSATTPPTLTTFDFLTSSSGSDGIYWYSIGI